MEMRIVPAIIAKTQEELDEAISRVKDCADTIQIDVMDNRFVPNSSINFDFNLPETDCIIEAHLMVESPLEWIKKHGSKVDLVLAHIESCRVPEEIIETARNNGNKIGFVINPETPVSAISEYIDQIDQALVMTVNPGFYGSPFLPQALEKVKELRELCPDLDIEVDGGITDKTIKKAADAGANIFVSGSYILKSENPREAMESLRKLSGQR